MLLPLLLELLVLLADLLGMVLPDLILFLPLLLLQLGLLLFLAQLFLLLLLHSVPELLQLVGYLEGVFPSLKVLCLALSSLQLLFDGQSDLVVCLFDQFGS